MKMLVRIIAGFAVCMLLLAGLWFAGRVTTETHKQNLEQRKAEDQEILER